MHGFVVVRIEHHAAIVFNIAVYGRHRDVAGLTVEQTGAVASPLLIGEARRPMSAETIIGYPLLHDAYHDGWTDWAKRAGISPDRIGENNIQYFDSGVLLQAAIDGQGIALGRRLLAEGDIQAGRLVRLDDICVALDKALYFVCRPGDNDRPAVAAFRQWLMSKR